MTTDPEEFTPGLGNRIQTDPEAVAALVERIKEHGIYQSDPIFIDAAALIEALVSERDTLVVESYDMTAFYTAAVDELHWANVSMESGVEELKEVYARLAAAEKVVEAAREDLIWIREAASSGVLHPASGSEVADALAAYDKQKGGDGMSDDWEHDEPTNDDDDMWPEPHAERIEELRQRNFRRENEPTVAALQAKLDAVKRSVKDQLATDAGPWRDGGCSCEVCELARAILATIEGEKEPNTTEPT